MVSATHLTYSLTQPAGVSGITYRAEWSDNLTIWNAIPDTGSGTNHIFTTPTTGFQKKFIRMHLTQP